MVTFFWCLNERRFGGTSRWCTTKRQLDEEDVQAKTVHWSSFSEGENEKRRTFLVVFFEGLHRESGVISAGEIRVDGEGER